MNILSEKGQGSCPFYVYSTCKNFRVFYTFCGREFKWRQRGHTNCYLLKMTNNSCDLAFDNGAHETVD